MREGPDPINLPSARPQDQSKYELRQNGPDDETSDCRIDIESVEGGADSRIPCVPGEATDKGATRDEHPVVVRWLLVARAARSTCRACEPAIPPLALHRRNCSLGCS